MTHAKTPWYRMDNSSFMYSAIQREKYSAVYRFSAMMAEEVDSAALQLAIDKTMPRFPGFSVRIKNGFFWHYFEPNRAPGPFISKDMADPCQPVRFKEDNGWLVRFYCYERRISLEVFHAIADGAGALVFFRTLLAEYLRQRGYSIPISHGIFDLDEEPKPEEFEDAYMRHAGPISRAFPLIKRAYQNKGTPEPFYTFRITMGFVPLDKLKEKARSHRVSITEYLAAILMKILLDKQHSEHPTREKPITLGVPINLRAFFPSATLRNFIINMQPSVDASLGEYSLEQIIKLVHHYMRMNMTPQLLGAALTRGVRLQYNPILQLVPSAIKNPIMSISYKTKGVQPYSAIFTNPGSFDVPDEMRPHIEHMEAILGQATVARPHVASISYGNTMEITFSGTQKQTGLERDFFRHLVKEGIPVHIESNRQ